jgi:hypothetical protein
MADKVAKVGLPAIAPLGGATAGSNQVKPASQTDPTVQFGRQIECNYFKTNDLQIKLSQNPVKPSQGESNQLQSVRGPVEGAKYVFCSNADLLSSV